VRLPDVPGSPISVVFFTFQIFSIITSAYLMFWGPLFLVTLFHPHWEWKDAKQSMLHEVTPFNHLVF